MPRIQPRPPSHKGRQFPITILTPDEVRQLIDATPARSSSGVRMRALIGVLFGSALRIAEVLALKPADVQGRQVFVEHGKARSVGLDVTGRDLLDRWLDRRTQLGLNGRHPIFATYSSHSFGKPMTQRDVRKALVRAAERAGISKRVHPHGLRHSLAFDLARTQPMHVVQGQLGHADLATTVRYLTHLELIQRDVTMDVIPACHRWVPPIEAMPWREWQGDRCALGGNCDGPLEVDHCHDTGLERGYLCRSCNVRESRGHGPAIWKYRIQPPSVICRGSSVYVGAFQYRTEQQAIPEVTAILGSRPGDPKVAAQYLQDWAMWGWAEYWASEDLHGEGARKRAATMARRSW